MTATPPPVDGTTRNMWVRLAYVVAGAAMITAGALVPALAVLVPIGIGTAALGVPTPGVKHLPPSE